MAKILVFSQDVIGTSMAGPGIRYWEFATALSKNHKVTLASPNVSDVASDKFRTISYEHTRIPELLTGYDVVITQNISPAMGFIARRRNIKIILDAYDPLLLEALEIHRHDPAKQQRAKNRRYWTEMNLSLLFADAIICASEKQRDLWVGALMALNRIQPESYHRDNTMRQLVDVVPFGLRQQNPKSHAGVGFRKQYGIKPTDTVLVWAGGIYDWYDTPTLIKAMGIISRQRSDIKLMFLGLKHPNAGVPQSAQTAHTKQLADDAKLTDKTVFFNFGWIPYEDWPSYLLETDIGMSNHFDHLETRFSFRTRVIDSYLWGLRPIITTKGDAMADLVLMHDIGRTVDYGDAEQLAAAIIELADDPKAYGAIQKRMEQLREEYRWEKVMKPVASMIDQLGDRPSRRYSWQEINFMLRMYSYILQRVYQDKGPWRVATNLAAKAYRLTFRRF
jgi:glycosyltransferase involved in cell wall biosynthesis